MNRNEILLYPKYVWADNTEGKKPYSIYEMHKNDPVGTEYYSEYGAPATGFVKHRSTRIDDEGIHAIVIEDYCRELTIADVI